MGFASLYSTYALSFFINICDKFDEKNRKLNTPVNVLQRGTIWKNVLQRGTIWKNVVQKNAQSRMNVVQKNAQFMIYEIYCRNGTTL